MANHEVPYCHGRAMTQTTVNYSNPLSYQYRCDHCGRSVFVEDKPKVSTITLEDLATRNGCTVDELLKRSDQLRPRP